MSDVSLTKPSPAPPVDRAPLATAQSRPSREPAAKRFWRQALLAVTVLAGCYFVYGRLPISVLRAESGIYLNRGAGSPAELAHFAAANFARSYNGHYTPFAFDIELACAALFGTSESWWRLRQLLYLSFFVLAAFAFWNGAATRLGLARSSRLLLALGGTALFACSPLLIELVAWPFMGMQILWAAMTMGCLHWLNWAIAGATNGEGVSSRALTIALAFAYGSLHCLGLGLATMAGYVAVIAVLLGVAWVRKASSGHFRRLALLGGGAVVLAAAHGSMMIFTLPPVGPRPRLAGGAVALLEQSLGYISCGVFACARSLWSPNAWAWPRVDLLAQDWPYGVGVVGLLLLYLHQLWQRWRAGAAGGDARPLVQLCWHVFSLAAFGFGVLMIAARVWKGEPWLGYLLGSRYLWPFAVLLGGTLGSLALHLRFRDRLLAPAFGLLLTGVCTAGNLVYQAQVAPTVWPNSILSQERLWGEIVAMTGELRAAHLPLPDLSMQRVGEFNEPLHIYTALLRRSHGLPLETQFEWIAPSATTQSLWEEMKRRSPSLVRLTQTVFVEADRALNAAAPAGVQETSGGRVVAVLTDPELLRGARLERVKDQPNLGVDIEIAGVSKPSIWIDPPTSLTYPGLRLGSQPSLRCAIAIHPLVWKESGADGAVFRVTVRVDGENAVLGERYLNPISRLAERGWNTFNVDLSRYAGRKVDLILDNTPGPSGNDYADWCIWGDAVLMERSEPPSGH